MNNENQFVRRCYIRYYIRVIACRPEIEDLDKWSWCTMWMEIIIICLLNMRAPDYHYYTDNNDIKWRRVDSVAPLLLLFMKYYSIYFHSTRAHCSHGARIKHTHTHTANVCIIYSRLDEELTYSFVKWIFPIAERIQYAGCTNEIQFLIRQFCKWRKL